LIELCTEGEGIGEATERCARTGARTQAATLVALNTGSLRAPKLTSDGIASALRFTVEFADYDVRMTPDPRRARRADRPIPAEGIRDAIRDAGYSVLGRKRTRDDATHQLLSERAEISRRRISKICSGEINALTAVEADAILVALDREDLYDDLVASFVEAAERDALAIEEALDEIYELFWICSAVVGDDERWALDDLHALYGYGQLDAETIKLPFPLRRKVGVDRFRELHGRWPDPVPVSLRTRALNELARRRDEALEHAAVAQKGIGPPERVNAAYARDLVRRARLRGIIDWQERPIAFSADRVPTRTRTDRGCERAREQRNVGRPRNIHERRLQQAERGIERELVELRVLRAASDLERDDPRRTAYTERFDILAAKGARRAEFRKREFTKIARSNTPSKHHSPSPTLATK
jgi:hypothetical protein